MADYEQLQAIIAGLDPRITVTTMPAEEALGTALQQEIRADRPMPPFDKAAVDGFACRMEDLDRELELLETIPAGSMPTKKILQGQCSRIMTGAAIPAGADGVFMIEDAEFPAPGRVRCTNAGSKKNICYLGEDYLANDLLLQPGCLLGPAQLAVIAGAGYRELKVSAPPRIALIVTGSELVEYHEEPAGGKIRNTNALQLLSLLKKIGLKTAYRGIVADERETLLQSFREAEQENEVVLFTGGAAVGDFDLVPGLISDEGYELLWTRTGMKPGNPMCFGIKGEKYVFGMSGNPVSSFVQFEFLVKPVLFRLMGAAYRPFRIKAVMGQDWYRKNASRFGVVPVGLNSEGEIMEVPFNGSAHLHALAAASALMEIPAGLKEIRKGDPVYVRPL
ncbi:MAG: molybdopterin molybdotransferase MoeA [Bacteroidota bacterium]